MKHLTHCDTCGRPIWVYRCLDSLHTCGTCMLWHHLITQSKTSDLTLRLWSGDMVRVLVRGVTREAHAMPHARER